MNSEYICFEQLIVVVTELKDISRDNLMVKSREGRFPGFIYITDSEDVPVWKTREVFALCRIVFGKACTDRMRAAGWDVVTQDQRDCTDWLSDFGKKI